MTVAYSELSSRLEHLVTYSSQLIFVSGDTIAEQQKSLYAFLGRQSENAEVAFLTAQQNATVQHYRQQICKQLTGQESGLFARPLNELLAPLNQHDGPVLICLTQSEHLPPKFLQELWDLVLQSRFAANKQHLNVLLFGKSEWAQQAKTWLPAKNRDKPLLLSTESVAANPPPSELDALIAAKRKQFQQRLKNRAQQPAISESSLQTWWFRGLMILAFLSAFCGILMWQYADDLNTIWQQNASVVPVQSPQSETQPSEANDALQTIDTPPEATVSMPAGEQAEIEIVNTPSEETTRTPDSDQQPVLNWTEAVNTIQAREQVQPAQSEDTTVENNLADASGPTDTPISGVAEAETVEQTGLAEEEELGGYDALDYPVEDIVSVEQLAPEQPADVPSTLESKTSAEMASGTLMELPQNEFIIQVAAMSSQQVMQEFLVDHKLSDSVWIYKTERFGGDWYVLLHKQSYPSLAAARADMVNLSNAEQLSTPFAKSVSQVWQELAVAGSRQLQ